MCYADVTCNAVFVCVFWIYFFFQPLPISKYAVVKKKVVKGKMIVGMALFQK
jgi:hypothetical protein